jgi:hypothetical protein
MNVMRSRRGVVAAPLSALSDVPLGPADEGAESGCCGVNLIVVRAVGKGAQFLDESVIPGSCHELNETVLTLRSERVCTIGLAALLALGGDMVTAQLAGQIVRLKPAGTSRILRDADHAFFAIQCRYRLDLLFDLAR